MPASGRFFEVPCRDTGKEIHMPTIVKRGTVWQAKIRRRGVPTLSRTFDLKADAEAWAREMEREVQRGSIVMLRDDAARTTMDWAVDVNRPGF